MANEPRPHIPPRRLIPTHDSRIKVEKASIDAGAVAHRKKQLEATAEKYTYFGKPELDPRKLN